MANASPSQGSTYEKFDIISLDGSKTVPLKGGVVEFQYFEDLFYSRPPSSELLTFSNSSFPTLTGITSSTYPTTATKQGKSPYRKHQTNRVEPFCWWC